MSAKTTDSINLKLEGEECKELDISKACPWCHRLLLLIALKGLQNIISVTNSHPHLRKLAASLSPRSLSKLSSQKQTTSDGPNITSFSYKHQINAFQRSQSISNLHTNTNNANINDTNTNDYGHDDDDEKKQKHSKRKSLPSNNNISKISKHSKRSHSMCTTNIRRKQSYLYRSKNHNEDCRNIKCVCGRRMKYTQNPQNKYPPNAVLRCQQSINSIQCKNKIVVENDWFYFCKARTSEHGTNDGKYKICYSCSKSLNLIKEGFMMKKGNIWNKSFKKRYFQLLEDKRLFYYKNYENGATVDKRGVADLNVIKTMVNKGQSGFVVTTPEREWTFLCNSSAERDDWYNTINKLCRENKRFKKAKTHSSI